MHAPSVKPAKSKDYTSKQSEYEMCAKCPFRSIILGPSGSGKTILLQTMILDIYRGCFDRVYIFSPSVHLDHTWYPVKEYVKTHMKVEDSKEEPIYFDHYDQAALTNIIDTQTQITEHMKKKGKSKMFQILIVIDDFADDRAFSRNSSLLHSLYTRGRHSFISTITATQVFNALAPIIRKNATELYCYRLRNYKDLETLVEELSALCSKKDLLEMYKEATDEPYSFWYINLCSKDINNMFYIRFDHRFRLD
jgi:GTPase SAR1 family protein